jgi:hypothetical protein
MKKPFIASLINAIILIALSLWGYLGSETPSLTALIPAAGGVILIALNSGLKKENKIVAHVVVLLTFVLLLGLIKPLLGAIDRADNGAIMRVVLIMISSVYAMAAFINNFIEVRQNRKKNAAAGA